MAIKQITKEELKKKLDDKNVVIVNVLDKEDYDKAHIKGSISIPYEELIVDGWKKLDKGKEIITYCKNTMCSASREAAEFLGGKGFSVKAYEGGIEEWTKAKYPAEGSDSQVWIL